MSIMRLPLSVRFWPKVNKTDGCWLFTGKIDRLGYGQIRDEAHKHTPAHRASWRLVNGPIPAGVCVLHRCDNRRCVNPAHLFLGTIQDNKRDEVQKGRHLHGVTHWKARITEADVREIRLQFASGVTAKELAAKYTRTTQSIKHIVERRQWRHVA
jgi:hypothetical protein